MKSLKLFLGVFMLAFLMALVTPFAALAADAAALTPPDWLASLIGAISSFPYVGPVVVVILKWAGVVAAIATALSVCVQAILAALSGALGLAGLQAAADKVKAISDKVMPWLQYLSMFNVQKK